LNARLRSVLPGESSLIEGMANDLIRWTGLSIFQKAVPKEEREAVLDGSKRIRIPIEQAPEEAKIYERLLWSRGNAAYVTGPTGARQKLEGSRYLEIQTVRGGSMVPPTLLIGYEHKGSQSYCGGPPLQ